MQKTKAIISAGAVVAAGLAVTPVLGAQAAYSDTPANAVGLWQNNNYDGDFLGYRWAGLGLKNISDGNDNRTSSWANRTQTNARWYQLAGGGGFCISMGKASYNTNLVDAQNDKLSSWATDRAC